MLSRYCILVELLTTEPNNYSYRKGPVARGIGFSLDSCAPSSYSCYNKLDLPEQSEGKG